MTSFINPPKQMRILELIRGNPGMTINEISVKVPCHPKTVRGYMRTLKQENLITHRYSLEDVRQWTWYPVTGTGAAVIKIEAKA